MTSVKQAESSSQSMSLGKFALCECCEDYERCDLDKRVQKQTFASCGSFVRFKGLSQRRYNALKAQIRKVRDKSARGGGCDTQQVLPLETPEAVRDHVRHNLEIFTSSDGGYVFTQVHNIQQTVPIENVEAMFAAAYEFAN